MSIFLLFSVESANNDDKIEICWWVWCVWRVWYVCLSMSFIERVLSDFSFSNKIYVLSIPSIVNHWQKDELNH